MMAQALPISIDRRDNLLQARHQAYEIAWDMDRGGTLVYLHDRRSQVTLLDARAGGPAPDVLVCASPTLEEKEHEIRMSALGRAAVEIFTARDGQ